MAKQGNLAGKVAFITGGARGQGRSHAVRLAEDGADIVIIDVPGEVLEGAGYPLSTAEDLAETVAQVEQLDRRVLAREGDVRDLDFLEDVVAQAQAEFGHIDIVCANAGVGGTGFDVSWRLSRTQWQSVIDINLTGVWHTIKATVPALLASSEVNRSIVLTSSTMGLKGTAHISPYVAAKHGVIGLMRTLALELGPERIRVNAVAPTAVATDMLLNEEIFGLFRPDLEHPTQDDTVDSFKSINVLPVPWVEARDVSNAIAWLVSDDARYVTGVALPVDAGLMVK